MLSAYLYPHNEIGTATAINIECIIFHVYFLVTELKLLKETYVLFTS